MIQTKEMSVFVGCWQGENPGPRGTLAECADAGTRRNRPQMSIFAVPLLKGLWRTPWLITNT
jgi:hypothetical protein